MRFFVSERSTAIVRLHLEPNAFALEDIGQSLGERRLGSLTAAIHTTRRAVRLE